MVVRERHAALTSRMYKNGAQQSARCERLSQAMNGRFLYCAPMFSGSPHNSCRLHLIYYLNVQLLEIVNRFRGEFTLGTSAEGTVRVHTLNLYRKLRVNTRRAAVTLAKALGLLTAN